MMRPLRLLGLGFLVFSAACAAGRTTTTTPKDAPEGADEPAAEEEADEAAPHALGTIVLGESRSSATGDSKPLISATFLPDAKLARSCTKKVDACEVIETPKCTSGAVDGCGSGEICTFDDDCDAKCVKACTKACGAGEACYFTSDGPGIASQDDMDCRPADRFDAGALAFDGTTQAITLFPPYGVTPNGNGAPFLARTEIRVQASGATAAGFETFDETFHSTTFLQTDPPLRDLSRADVFGSDGLTVGWVPGEDTVYVGVSGAGGVAKCAAEDETGTFDLSRDVIRKVTSGSAGSTALSISVTRERREVRKGKKVFGELSGGQTVQPEGWVELVTRSAESHSFTSCGTGASLCGDECVDLDSDEANCGACGKTCPTSYYCSLGTCQY